MGNHIAFIGGSNNHRHRYLRHLINQEKEASEQRIVIIRRSLGIPTALSPFHPALLPQVSIYA